MNKLENELFFANNDDNNDSIENEENELFYANNDDNYETFNQNRPRKINL